MDTPLLSVNLSLSSACGANCLFCPSDRGANNQRRNMSLESVKKIVDEMASERFAERYKTVRFQVGENGDTFSNKQAIDIFRYIKAKLNVSIYCTTNFQNLTEEKSDIILRENLVDDFGMNIDGHNEENYFSVKRLHLDNTMKNLRAFIRLRQQHKAKTTLTVSCVTLKHYIQAVQTCFGRLPLKLTDPALAEIEDDSDLVEAAILPLLRPNDTFCCPSPFFWAERDGVDTSSLVYENYVCPLLQRVYQEAFISPDGTWYACCLDSKNKLVVGNVLEQSLDDVARSPKRETLIRMLAAKQFAQIGPPCDTVNCCYGWGTNKGQKIT